MAQASSRPIPVGDEVIDPEVIVGWACTGAIIIGHAAVANYKNNQNARDIASLWKWKSTHERDSVEIREKIQTQIFEIKGAQRVVDEKLSQIIAILQEIKDRLTEVETIGRRS